MFHVSCLPYKLSACLLSNLCVLYVFNEFNEEVCIDELCVHDSLLILAINDTSNLQTKSQPPNFKTGLSLKLKMNKWLNHQYPSLPQVRLKYQWLLQEPKHRKSRLPLELQRWKSLELPSQYRSQWMKWKVTVHVSVLHALKFVMSRFCLFEIIYNLFDLLHICHVVICR